MKGGVNRSQETKIGYALKQIQTQRRNIMLNKMVKKDEKGFTLIELMIVIAIIGILAAIAIPQFSAYRERAFVTSMQADVAQVRTAQETYFSDNDAYADSVQTLIDSNAGIKALSGDNEIAIAITEGPPPTYTVTATSTKTDRTVVYDSATALTTTSE